MPLRTDISSGKRREYILVGSTTASLPSTFPPKTTVLNGTKGCLAIKLNSYLAFNFTLTPDYRGCGTRTYHLEGVRARIYHRDAEFWDKLAKQVDRSSAKA